MYIYKTHFNKSKTLAKVQKNPLKQSKDYTQNMWLKLHNKKITRLIFRNMTVSIQLMVKSIKVLRLIRYYSNLSSALYIILYHFFLVTSQ